VGGGKVVIQIAPPSKSSRAQLARIFRHELRHILGEEHDDMSEENLWSKGPEPDWSSGKRLRYVRRGQSVEDELR
jgi:glutamate dehydrogenase/leucine dehydrogenase